MSVSPSRVLQGGLSVRCAGLLKLMYTMSLQGADLR
jgi:hypothetical protein